MRTILEVGGLVVGLIGIVIIGSHGIEHESLWEVYVAIPSALVVLAAGVSLASRLGVKVAVAIAITILIVIAVVFTYAMIQSEGCRG